MIISPTRLQTWKAKITLLIQLTNIYLAPTMYQALF